jgi:hypothetical protein
MRNFQSGDVNLMLDSGTTLTYFPKNLYKKITEWIKEILINHNKNNAEA